MKAGSPNEPLTVGQLNRLTRETLEQMVGQVWVRGELTALSKPASGHWYFTLKDELGQISCALFKYRVQTNSITVGSEVLVFGAVTLYEQRGQYQMIVESIVPWGMGQRYVQFEALKKKLYDEGLLDVAYKKTLPRFPRCISIISSAQAAGFQDVLVILQRRYPVAKIRLYPTMVQGDEAVPGLLRAIDRVEEDAHLVDVVMMVRGGGSPEDLWCFNDERLSRRVFDMKLPLITGIGHEIDTSLVDLVADVRAPTPSAAAEMVVPDQSELLVSLSRWSEDLNRSTLRSLDRLWIRLDNARIRWISPKDYLLLKTQQIEQYRLRIQHASVQRSGLLKHQLSQLELRMLRVSPHLKMQQLVQEMHWRMQQGVRRYLDLTTRKLEQHRQLLNARDPAQLLEGGWSWVEGDQGRLNGIHEMVPGSKWRIWVAGGNADVVVERQNMLEE